MFLSYQVIITAIVAVAMVKSSIAQSAEFKPLRYDDSFHEWNDSANRSFYRNVKHLPVPIIKDAFISFGGESRIQYFYLQNENWGDGNTTRDRYGLFRNLLHADLHITKRFRTFAQLQSSASIHRSAPSPLDDNRLSLHQAFADFGNSRAKGLFVRVGRQEMLFGSQRLISVREGPNSRQSFNAARVVFTSPGFKADLFYAQPLIPMRGVFDDKNNFDIKLAGLYFTRNNVAVLGNVDLYSLLLLKSSAQFDDGAGSERRYSFGTRIWHNTGNWMYDFEAVAQSGSFAGKRIRAFTVSLHGSKSLALMAHKMVFSFKTEIISGDGAYGDRKLGTFNPLFPRGGYFGLAALIGPSNLIDVHPSIDYSLTPQLTVNVDYDLFFRHSVNDGVYAPNTQLLYSGKNSESKKIGGQLAAAIMFEHGNHFNMRGEFTWFKTKKFLQQVSAGKDIYFTGITTQFKW